MQTRQLVMFQHLWQQVFQLEAELQTETQPEVVKRLAFRLQDRINSLNAMLTEQSKLRIKNTELE